METQEADIEAFDRPWHTICTLTTSRRLHKEIFHQLV